MRQSQTKRSFKREVISRIYNAFIKVVLSTRFSDAQCGFKALSRSAVEAIIPTVEDQAWFFDTECSSWRKSAVTGSRISPCAGLKTTTVASRSSQTGWEDIKGVFRLRRHLVSGNLAAAQVANADRSQQ